MSRRPVARKKLTWRTYWDSDAGLIAGYTGGSGGQNELELITAAEVQDLDDECTLKRVVGEIYFLFSPQDGMSAMPSLNASFGLLVLNDTIAFSNIDLGVAGDVQDMPWAWLRTYRLAGSSVTQEGGNVAHLEDAGSLAGAHIDVRVARRLEEGDRLLLYQRATTSGGPDYYFTTWTNLRILLEA